MPSASPVSAQPSFGHSIEAGVYRMLERELSIETDSRIVERYVRTVFGPAAIGTPSGARPLDRGQIRIGGGTRCIFNREELELEGHEKGDPLRAAFYGASRLARASFQRDAGWLTFHAAAVAIDGKAVILAGRPQVGKTTLALALLERGARLYSDEFVHLHRAKRTVTGLRRTMLIRDRALGQIANRRVLDHCLRTDGRSTERGWRIWDDLDPRAVAGDDVFAGPMGLGAVFILEAGEPGWASALTPCPSSVAALGLIPRLCARSAGLEPFSEIARLLDGVGTYRLALRDVASAANAIVARTDGAR